MFANLKKKIESEVGDLSRLAPSNVLNRNNANSSTLSSRHPSVSSLTSEPPNLNVSGLPAPLSPNPVGDGGGGGTGVTPSRGAGGHSLLGIKVKQLEVKLEGQESDFAWRLSTKDDEITNLNKTIEILTGQLRSQDSEVKKKLVRVQEDIDDLEGFSQQENAKLKHLLLNKEEELGGLRNDVFLKGKEIEELAGKVKELEVENGRVKVTLEKLSTGGGPGVSDKVDGLENDNKRLLGELEGERARFKKEVGELKGLLEKREGEVEGLRVKGLEGDARVKDLESDKIAAGELVSCLRRDLHGVELEKLNLEKELEGARGVMDELSIEADGVRRKLEAENQRLRDDLEGDVEEKYKRVCDENVGLRGKLENFRGEVNRLQGDNERAVNELRGFLDKIEGEKGSLEIVNGDLRKRVDELGVELEGVSVEVQSKRLEVGVLKESIFNLKGLLEKREGEVLVLKGKVEGGNAEVGVVVEGLKGRVKELEGECEALRTKGLEGDARVKELERDKIAVEEEVCWLRRDLDGARTEKLNLEKELQGVSVRLGVVCGEKDKFGDRVRELEGVEKKLGEDLRVVGNEKVELDRVLRGIRGEKRIVEEELAKLKGRCANFEKELVTQKGRCASFEEELVTQKGRCANLEEELVTQKGRCANLEEELVIQKGRCANLEEELVTQKGRCANLEEEVQALTGELEDAKNKREDGESQEVGRLRSKLGELEGTCEEMRENLLVEKERSEAREGELVEEVKVLGSKLKEVESEKDELIVNVSEVQSRVDELEEECKFLKSGGGEVDELGGRVDELERIVAEKEKQLRQQSHALSDLRRSLAKELKASSRVDGENGSGLVVDTLSSNHMNGSAVKLDSVSLSSDSAGAAATLPQYETDVNFMYLRSVMFKYLTSQDPQITAHLTRVVATLLHLTEEETNTLIQSVESRTNAHILSHIIK